MAGNHEMCNCPFFDGTEDTSAPSRSLQTGNVSLPDVLLVSGGSCAQLGVCPVVFLIAPWTNALRQNWGVN